MGSIYKQKDSRYYWIQYCRGGKVYRESTRSTALEEAKRILKSKEGAIADGRFPDANASKTRIDDLAVLYLKDYTLNRRRSTKEARRYADLITRHFGRMQAADLTTVQLMDYRATRRTEGVSDSTVNRELSALRRMYHLGHTHQPRLVIQVPTIEMVKEHNVRTGFFEWDEFRALRGALPDHLKVMAMLGYYTGMRKGEILGVGWQQVNLERGVLRLEPGTTKTGRGRLVPLVEGIQEALRQWKDHTIRRYPNCSWVCHYNGKRFHSIRRAWESACQRVGLGGRLFHDLRRTAIRNMVRAGIPERVAMTISGHKTRSVFDRYDIVSERDLVEAAGRLSRYVREEQVRPEAGIVLT